MKNHALSILFPPHGAVIFLTAVGQRHPRLRMTHSLKYHIQGCVNQVRRPQLKARLHPSEQDRSFAEAVRVFIFKGDDLGPGGNYDYYERKRKGGCQRGKEKGDEI